MQNTHLIQKQLVFLDKHQVVPSYSDHRSKHYRKSLWETQEDIFALCHLYVDTTDMTKPNGDVRSLRRVNEVYSEYVNNPDVTGCAFNQYVQLSAVDELCDYVKAVDLSYCLGSRPTDLDIQTWLLQLLALIYTQPLEQWNKHKSTLDKLVHCYLTHNTVFVLDKQFCDFVPAWKP